MKQIKVFLVGFMGSGKSASGVLLAQKTGYTHLDTDRLIEEKEGRKIAEIFASDGEDAFRLMERQVLKEIVQMKGNYIVSTGGGMPCILDHMALMKENGVAIYLRCTEEVLMQRLAKSKNKRPLLATSNPEETIRRKLEERKRIYEQAQITVNADAPLPEMVEEILQKIQKL